jgi:3-deoxy-D-manno-octulosonic-acid transferase
VGKSLILRVDRILATHSISVAGLHVTDGSGEQAAGHEKARIVGPAISAYNRLRSWSRSPLVALPDMYLIYSVLFTLGVVLTAPYYLWRLRGKGGSARWRERFGYLPDSFQQARPGAIWVHAVSVGETLAVVGLVRELQQRYPERKIFLSHVTPAGREAGENRLPSVAGRFYLPLDWRWAVRGTLERIRPAVLVIVETELWPNLLRAARESGARVILVNARLSDRSSRRYRLALPFMRRVLENVDRICVQTETDAERFRRLGARPEAVGLAGNLKFDAQPPQLGELPRLLEKALAHATRQPVLVAASTMLGEERFVLQAWKKIRGRHPRALLILAPRHPVRFEEVAQLLTEARSSFVRRTRLEAREDALAGQRASPEILLLDTIGELAGIFELADVVFMGGSLVPTGGHNLLEPAYWSKPIIFGPHMENFRDIAQLFLQAEAAVQIRDAHQLAPAALKLLEDGVGRQRMGEKAKQVLERESGATRRVLEHIRELLDAGVPLGAGT